MPAQRSWVTVALVGVLVVVGGCTGQKVRPASQQPGGIVPAGIAGTVGEYAVLVGGEPMMVRGWGVVVGLGENGSSEVPDALRKLLIRQMLRYGVGSATAGTAALQPDRMLADKDTAVVSVTGLIPPAAPEGTRFDLYLDSLPRSQTASLDGGHLMGTEMHLATGTTVGEFGDAKVWAMGRGPVFVNPFAERGGQPDQARLRSGLIPGGGTTSSPRMVRLELRQPDYRLAGQVRDRINQCFGGPDKVALARDPSLVDVRIPASYRRDYVHFLRLVLHVPLMGGPGDEETQARELARVILLPTALGDDISLVWEAMGRRVLPVVRELYTSDNPAAAFYSLRAGLGLDDALAVEPMTRVAIQNGAAFQIQAIEALGRARKFVECVPTLRNLLSGHSDLVRVAAYEALLEHGSAGIIRRLDVSGQFMLDVVESERDYAVYVTRTGQPKIVLFGQKIPIRRPVFYCPEDELVTINAGGEDEKIKVDRKVPRSIRRSDTFEVVPQVAELVQALGTLPNKGIDGKIEGLGLTYSQVVGVVYGLQKGGHMPARFVLQPLPEMRRIYASMSGAGRPDMPDEGR